MDGFQDKKWFVYLGDHHEGPFSLNDLQGKLVAGQVKSEAYVWAEGMTDWLPMAEVSSFRPILERKAVPSSPPPVSNGRPPGNGNFSDHDTSVRNALGIGSGEHTGATAANLRSETNAGFPILDSEEPNIPTTVEEPSLITIGRSEEVASTEPTFGETHPSLVEASSSPVGAEFTLEDAPSSQNQNWAQTARASSAAPAPVQVHLEEQAASPPGVELSPAHEPQGGSAAVEKSRGVSKFMKIALLLIFLSGLGAAVLNGAFDFIFQSQALRAGAQTLSESVRPQLLSLSEKFPALRKWISPIPQLEDVSPQEYEDLRKAAMTKLDRDGIKVALALSTAEAHAPFFYVTSNLPDGANLEVVVDGVSDTLLNQTFFQSTLKVTLDKKMGKTAVVRFPDGKPIPKGEYNVYVTEAPDEPDAVAALLAPLAPSNLAMPGSYAKGHKLVVSKSYFLGGAKDKVYAERLQAFHTKKKEQAASEIAEIKQFASTLDSQFRSSVTSFDKLRRGSNKPSKAQQVAWSAFHEGWVKLEGQLTESFDKWTPETLTKERFFGPLYESTKKTGTAVDRMHSIQNAYFTGATDPKSYEIQLGEASSQAQNSLAGLKAKIEEAEKLSPTVNGMPKRLEQ